MHRSQLSNTSQHRAWILDVGHGNSTVVEASGHVSIVDGGAEDTLSKFLFERSISHIDTIIVSHADADHFAGISLILSDVDIQVEKVYVNPDSRETDLWEDFIAVMRDAKSRGTEFNLELTSAKPGEVASDGIRLEVIAPSQELAYRTSNGRHADGRRLNPNGMSAVVRVWAGNSPRILLAGDIDQVGLDSLIQENPDITADVLVFPHHGGSTGGSNLQAFTNSLIEAVNPQLVIFSIGRGRYKTPRREIISAIIGSNENVHIACTQLSEHCASQLPVSPSDFHTSTSRGRSKSACCAGTLEISLENEITYSPSRNVHREFINKNAPKALCQAPLQ